MSGNPLNPRFGVFILSGGRATEQERHCTQAILERRGSTIGVFQFRDYQALFDAAAPDTQPVDPIYQQLLTRVLLTAYGDPELGVIQPQPFGYVRVDDRQQSLPAQSEALEGFIRRYITGEAQE